MLHARTIYILKAQVAFCSCFLGFSRYCTLLQVIELALQMTPAMTAIYDAIADIMDSCIKELRRSNKIDTTELTLEHGLFKSFDEHVRRQLEAVWHTVSPRTKQVRHGIFHTTRTRLHCIGLPELVVSPCSFRISNNKHKRASLAQ